jgi:hypothetical protein
VKEGHGYVVISGTMFSEVLIWTFSPVGDAKSHVLNRLKGHTVSTASQNIFQDPVVGFHLDSREFS